MSHEGVPGQRLRAGGARDLGDRGRDLAGREREMSGHPFSQVLRDNPRAQRVSDLQPMHMIAADEMDRLADVSRDLLKALKSAPSRGAFDNWDDFGDAYSQWLSKTCRTMIAKVEESG